jgi:alginate O-acetyltransferase complex protein AlgI
LFAFEELPKVGSYLQAMIGLSGRPLWDDVTIYFAYTNAILIVVLVVASLPRKSSSEPGGRKPMLNVAWCGVLFFLSVAYLVDATFNPFLYFRF